MKTSELIGPALDWAVAKCEGETLSQSSLAFQIKEHGCLQRPHLGNWKPSSSWAQGGPIIDRKRITLAYLKVEGLIRWEARYFDDADRLRSMEYGPTPLIAAMRCFCASKLGDEIEIPEELSK